MAWQLAEKFLYILFQLMYISSNEKVFGVFLVKSNNPGSESPLGSIDHNDWGKKITKEKETCTD